MSSVFGTRRTVKDYCCRLRVLAMQWRTTADDTHTRADPDPTTLTNAHHERSQPTNADGLDEQDKPLSEHNKNKRMWTSRINSSHSLTHRQQNHKIKGIHLQLLYQRKSLATLRRRVELVQMVGARSAAPKAKYRAVPFRCWVDSYRSRETNTTSGV